MLTFSQVLRTARKQRGVTQQTVADFIGVSKASVSKWETGQAYPDVTVLPLLAAYFDLSVDHLLGYQASMSTQAVQTLYRQLQADFQTQTGTAMWRRIDDVVHRYYASATVLTAMGSLVLNHYDMLPGTDLPAKTQHYVPLAQSWFDHAMTLADNAIELDKATKFSASCDLVLHQPEAMFAKLGTRTPERLPASSLIAMAYQLQGDTEQATVVLQSAIYQDLVVMLSGLTNYLAIIDAPATFTATYQRGQALIDAFSLASLNPLSALNFWSVSAVGFAQAKDVAHTAACLAALVPVLEGLQEPVMLHGDQYFDRIDAWLKATDQGGATPRNSGHLRQQLAHQLSADPRLTTLQTEPDIARWLQQLAAIA